MSRDPSFRAFYSAIGSKLVVLALLVGVTLPTQAEVPGLNPGSVELQSIGPMTFAEQGVLLVGDPKAATVFAIDTLSEAPASTATGGFPESMQIADLRQAVASALGVESSSVQLGDLAVDSKNQQIIVSAESGNQVSLLRVSPDGSVRPIRLEKVSHAKKQMPNPPEDKLVGQGRRRRNHRMESITDIAYFDGRVLVSGLSAQDSPSSVREFSFPFADNTIVTNVQIYHAAHGRVEEPAIRAFIPMMIDGKATLLAGFTCTPLVRFPLNEMAGDEKVRGTTVAELGNRNRPLDLISYKKDGQEHLLMSNSARGIMKITTKDIESAPGLGSRVSGGGTAGHPFETVDGLDDVVQMDKLNDQLAVVIQGSAGAAQRLALVPLP